MKRKNYFSFLFPRLIASLLIAAVLFSVLQAVLARTYESALYSGWNKRRETYEKLVKNYVNHKYDSTFIDIYTNLFASDYFRMAEVKEDGHFETVTETDYKSIPVEDGIHHWYYVTNDKELLSKGKRTYHSIDSDSDWTIEYKKCDEAWDISKYADTKVTNSWDIAAQSDVYFSDMLFTIGLDYSGSIQYRQPLVKSHYVDGDTLHLGKTILSYYDLWDEVIEPFWIKKWDFTDTSKADHYITVDNEGFAKTLYFFSQRVRPDEFLNANSGMFLANSLNELQKAYNSSGDKDMSFENLFKEYADNKFVSGVYKHRVNQTTENSSTEGSIDFYVINGKLYMIEYVITTVPFKTLFKPFLILMAVVLTLIAVIIACLASIRPYSQYKKAYENNIFKNNLIDSLAHNMKTPLQILGGYAENLKDVTSDIDKDRYADQILAKTAEMNKDIEAILKTAEKSDREFVKESVRTCIDEVASKLGAEVFAKGDMKIRMDKDYFKTAVYCLLDNAMKYKSSDSKIEVDITCNVVTIKNRTDKDKFTPGTGIAIAGRILEQHKLKMRTTLKDGVFECKFGKRLGKK